MVSAVAWIQGYGVSNAFRAVPVSSWQNTTIHIPNVFLHFGRTYTIAVAGEVTIVRPWSNRTYGEFIGRFPRIEIEAPFCFTELESEQKAQESFLEAIAEHETPEETCSALTASDDTFQANVRDLTEADFEGEESPVFESTNRKA